MNREIQRHLFTRRTQERAEDALGLLLAVAIGIGLAAALIAWWTA